MLPLEIQRRKMIERGINPDNMPDGYWEKAAKRRREYKMKRRGRQPDAATLPKKSPCKSCQLITEDDHEST